MNAIPATLEASSRGLQLQLFDGPRFRLVDATVASKAASTARTYRECFEAFARFVGQDNPEDALQALVALPAGSANALVLAYQDQLLRDGLAPGSINLRVAALRSACKTARRLGLTSNNLDVSGLKSAPYRDTRGPGTAAVSKALHELEGRGTIKAKRDRAIVAVMFDLGLRRAEAIGLDLEDVDTEACTVKIIGKGFREKQARTCPQQTMVVLGSWLEVRGGDPGPLFLSLDRARKGSGRLTGRAVWDITRRLGLGHPHGLRHASVTQALDSTNGNVRAVRAHSRHASVEVLMRYDDNRADLGGQVAGMVAAARA
jgi:integrase/recombinase XerC